MDAAVRRVGHDVLARVLARQLSQRDSRPRLRGGPAAADVQRRVRLGPVGVGSRRGRARQQEWHAQQQDAGHTAEDPRRSQSCR